MAVAAELVQALRSLDTEGTGEISLVVLDRFFKKLDDWFDEEKLELLSAAAGIISENGRISYVDFVEWLLRPGSMPCSRPVSRTSAVSNKALSGIGRPPGSVTMRFIHINDVYDLKCFPSLCTAIAELSSAEDADHVVTTMGGDFLAPYLLSQLDSGAGMIDCMNHLPISHCCFGNHECDVSHAALLKAIDTFSGKWLNSNMKGGGFGENPKLPSYDVMQIVSQDGSHRRRIGMLGLLCDYPYLYRDGVFNGATGSIEPVAPCCERLCADLVETWGCDVIVPMTHQNGPEDAALAARGRALRIPLILGGHDHNEVCDHPESQSACTLLKAGMDATKVGVVDLTWDSSNTEWPEVHARLLTTLEFEKDASMQKIVERHLAKVWALDYMLACRKPDMKAHVPAGTALPLSSTATRVGESSMATFLCTALRNALNADVAILEGGSVRAGTDKYQDRVTMSDLKAELPFKNDTLVVPMPGAVLAEAVRSSRAKVAEKGKYAFYLHCDKDCTVCPQTHCLTHVAGETFDAQREYIVAIGVDLGIGSGMNDPLMVWAAGKADTLPDKELAQPAEPLIEVYFLQRLWDQLPGFDGVLGGRAGALTEEEVEAAFTAVFFSTTDDSQRAVVKPMVQHLMRHLGKSPGETVSREDYENLLRVGRPGLES